VKDLSRSIDYLETREDIDMSCIGYIGDSWGGRLGMLIPAVEERLRLSILLRGGFRETQSFPEVDEFNYLSRVKVPTLMLNGIYDFTFPFETTVKPVFDLLGTPEEEKKLVLCETDHFIPTSLMVGEVLDWLDKYFGPVKH
jgi:cephalosporin-C deacetylase-like acetyl esterase